MDGYQSFMPMLPWEVLAHDLDSLVWPGDLPAVPAIPEVLAVQSPTSPAWGQRQHAPYLAVPPQNQEPALPQYVRPADIFPPPSTTLPEDQGAGQAPAENQPALHQGMVYGFSEAPSNTSREPTVVPNEPPKRGRGRPKGSKDRTKRVPKGQGPLAIRKRAQKNKQRGENPGAPLAASQSSTSGESDFDAILMASLQGELSKTT